MGGPSMAAVAIGFIVAVGVAPGCTCDSETFRLGGHRDLSVGADLRRVVAPGDLPVANCDLLNACGDFEMSCTVAGVGPSPGAGGSGMFPLPSDRPAPDGVTADGVGRNPMGWLVLDSTHASFDFLWVADDTDYGVGMVSKVSTKARTPPPGPINRKYAQVAGNLTG